MIEILNTGAFDYTNYKDYDKDYLYLEKDLINYIFPFIIEEKILIDIGCGQGHYLKYILELTSDIELIGIEPKVSNMPSIVNYDLTIEFDLKKKGNILCLEVLEHIPLIFEDTAISNIVKHCSNYLFISWAHRGQCGYGHVNERDMLEVIKLFETRGFTYLIEYSENSRQKCIAWWVKKNFCIFKKI